MDGGAEAATGAAPMPAQPSPQRQRRRGHRTPATSHMPGHARFLQHLFRGYRRLRPGGWGIPGGLRGAPAPRRS
eukprot:5555460-Prymnesium_polylepis.1